MFTKNNEDIRIDFTKSIYFLIVDKTTYLYNFSMAVNYKAPITDILFAFDVLNSYEKLNNIDRFKDFNIDIAVPAIEECSKFAEEVVPNLAPEEFNNFMILFDKIKELITISSDK